MVGFPVSAVRKAADFGLLLVSEKTTMDELADVLSRPKFDRYVSIEDRQQFLRLLGRVAEFVTTGYPVRECRDPKDDKFLEVALNGKADLRSSLATPTCSPSTRGVALRFRRRRIT